MDGHPAVGELALAPRGRVAPSPSPAAADPDRVVHVLSARTFRATGRTAGQEGEMHIRTIRVILRGEGPSDINRRSHDGRSQG